MKKFILSMSINTHTIRHSVGKMINTAPLHYEIMWQRHSRCYNLCSVKVTSGNVCRCSSTSVKDSDRTLRSCLSTNRRGGTAVSAVDDAQGRSVTSRFRGRSRLFVLENREEENSRSPFISDRMSPLS